MMKAASCHTSLADLVLGEKHVWNTATNLVDVLAVGANHLALNDMNL